MIKLKSYWKRVSKLSQDKQMEFLKDSLEVYQYDPKHYIGFYAALLLAYFFMVLLTLYYLASLGIVFMLIHAIFYMYRFLKVQNAFIKKWS